MGSFWAMFYKTETDQIEQPTQQSIWEFFVNDIDGQKFPMKMLSDRNCKALIIVNVACKCSFASTNYKQLSQLYQKYHEKGLEILAFPSNQFMEQEPWDPQQIKQHVVDKYKIPFPLMEKVDVNGPNAHEIFRYLRFDSSLNDRKKGRTKQVPWNYAKFLVDGKGKVVGLYQPDQLPNEMEPEIVKLLGLQ